MEASLRNLWNEAVPHAQPGKELYVTVEEILFMLKHIFKSIKVHCAHFMSSMGSDVANFINFTNFGCNGLVITAYSH